MYRPNVRPVESSPRPEGGETEFGFGTKVDNYGAHVRMFGLALPAVRAEAAGVDSRWLTDHVLMRTSTKSSFPFSDDGAAHWNPDDP